MTAISVPVQRAALFLDLDGTLAGIERTPSDVRPDFARSALLKWAHRALGGRLAVISGRTLQDIDRILEGHVPCAAGVHGLQRRTACGEIEAVTPHPALEEAHAAFEAVAQAQSGLIVEPKELSMALHYRGAPTAQDAVRVLAQRLAQSTGLVVQEGAMVAELKTPGPDKGGALEAFMAEAPFRGAAPIFVGDDLTDEAGFKAARRAGGAGILIGPPRDTGAVARFDSPGDLLAWMAWSLDTGAFVIGEPL